MSSFDLLVVAVFGGVALLVIGGLILRHYYLVLQADVQYLHERFTRLEQMQHALSEQIQTTNALLATLETHARPRLSEIPEGPFSRRRIHREED